MDARAGCWQRVAARIGLRFVRVWAMATRRQVLVVLGAAAGRHHLETTMTDTPPGGTGSGQPPHSYRSPTGQPWPHQPVFDPATTPYTEPTGHPGADQAGYRQPTAYGQPGNQQAAPGYGQQAGAAGYGQQAGAPRYGQSSWQGSSGMMVAPGGVPLRPLGVGDILSGTFTLIRQNPMATVGLAFIGAIAGVIVAIVLGALANRSGAQLLAEIPAFLLDAAVGGGVLAALGRALLGRKLSVSEALRSSRMGWVLLSGICYWLMVALAWYLPLRVLSGFGILIAFPLAAWLGIMTCLSFPVVVLERRNSLAAIRRSWQLVRGSFWRFLGVFTLLFIVMIAMSLFIGTLVLVAGAVSFSTLRGHGAIAGGAAVGALIATAVLYFALSSIVMTLWASVIVLLYADARMRKEGMDLVLQQAAASQRLTGEEFGAGPGSGWPASPGYQSADLYAPGPYPPAPYNQGPYNQGPYNQGPYNPNLGALGPPYPGQLSPNSGTTPDDPSPVQDAPGGWPGSPPV